MAYKDPEYKIKWRLLNKEDQNKKARDRYKINPEYYKEIARKSRYGITKEEYNYLLDTQKGCCAICKKHQTEFKRKLSVDHCHTTEKVRGLLCIRCNTLLGIFEKYKDNFEIYLNADNQKES